jgi:hypothetical protein
LGTHGQAPQSTAQVVQLSPKVGWQIKSPHLAGGQQSLAHVEQDSPGSQLPLPQVVGQTPQSLGHCEQVSPATHTPSPQTAGHAPQSCGQTLQDSPSLGLQMPSPQVLGWTAQTPVNVHTDPGPHRPQLPPQPLSPHCLPAHWGTQVDPQPPQPPLHRSTHSGPHATWQQNGSFSQTHFSHEQPLQVGNCQALQPSLLGHAPQSLAHSRHVSPGSHLPLPHCAGQGPQSLGQLLQDSPWALSHSLSPQTGLHGPQSLGQLLQDSPGLNGVGGSHLPLPQAVGQGPQSLGQELQVSNMPFSDGPQMPSPQPNLHGPQSVLQVLQVSPAAASHLASPQTGPQLPQSPGQELHDSPGLHTPLPHKLTPGQLWPHSTH